MTAEIPFKYFSPLPGRAVSRFGTSVHIGAERGPQGFVIDPEAISAIPVSEVERYAREYAQAVANGDLKERTREEYEARRQSREAPAPAKPEQDASDGTKEN